MPRYDGPRFRTLREEAGVRMVDVAREAECSYPHLRMFETSSPDPGGRTWNRDVSAALAHRLARAVTALSRSGRAVTVEMFTADATANAA